MDDVVTDALLDLYTAEAEAAEALAKVNGLLAARGLPVLPAVQSR